MKIFPLEYGFGDFSFEKWRFFLLKICSWRFFLEDLFWRLNFWKNFNEDLFIEIFPLEYGFWDFSFEKWRFFLLKICLWKFFLEDFFLEIEFLKIFLWRFVHGDFSLKIYSRYFSIEVLEIFNEDLIIGLNVWRLKWVSNG